MKASVAAEPGPGSLEEHRNRSWEFFRSIGAPRLHVTPMVDQVSGCMTRCNESHFDKSCMLHCHQPLLVTTLSRSQSWRSGCCAERTVPLPPTLRCFTLESFRRT